MKEELAMASIGKLVELSDLCNFHFLFGMSAQKYTPKQGRHIKNLFPVLVKFIQDNRDYITGNTEIGNGIRFESRLERLLLCYETLFSKIEEWERDNGSENFVENTRSEFRKKLIKNIYG